MIVEILGRGWRQGDVKCPAIEPRVFDPDETITIICKGKWRLEVISQSNKKVKIRRLSA